MELKNLKHFHFTGIKGVAMTSLALCAQDKNIIVTGTDTDEIFVTDEVLKERGIKWNVGFGNDSWSNKPDLLITTGAHGGLGNPEVISAQKEGIPVITQAEALNLFSQGKKQIVTCGVGGKTTTASMIANLLTSAGMNPSYAIGVGEIFPLGYGGKFNKEGKYFICEGDEFAISPGINNLPKFSILSPKVVVVTNIEYDHPDIYPTIEDTKQAFLNFFGKIPQDGLLVASADNKIVRELLGKIKVPFQTYGFFKDSDWLIRKVSTENQKTYVSFNDIKGKGYKVKLNVVGEYNVKNAVSAFVVGKFLGIPDKKLIAGIESFIGVKRRFERVGKSKSGFEIYDDYAHHPEEIKSVLKAAKEHFPNKRLIAIFQPHTYSRTKALLSKFAESFEDADLVLIMDIYSSAREEKDPQVSSEILVHKANQFKKEVYYSGNHQKTMEYIKKFCKKDDIVFTLGAGDIFYLHNKMLES